jgi:uncharacterized Rossmann fold enzyme
MDHGDVVIVPGFGTGHHIRAHLASGRRIVVIEPDPCLVRTAMEHADCTDFTSTDNVVLVIGEAAEEIDRCIGDYYLPALHGSAIVADLPGQREAMPDAYGRMKQAIARGLERLKDDFAVQSRFGRLWMRNTLANLRTLANEPARLESDLSLFRARDVLVAAAGPSLDTAIPKIGHDEERPVLATDSALPSLCATGVPPAAVITVDPQQASYLHHLAAGRTRVPLYADLAAPPALLQAYGRVVPLVSGHPLHQLIVLLGLQAPSFDSSGGNVTHAAVSIAASLGARSIRLAGADFSFPDGEVYPREAASHRILRSIANRTRPFASLRYSFLQDRPGVYRDPEVRGRYRQVALDRYRDALMALCDTLVVPVRQDPGPGVAIAEQPQRTSRPSRAEAGRVRTPAAGYGAVELPQSLPARLRMLFREVTPRVEWFDSLRGAQTTERAVLLALIPLVAWHRHRNTSGPGDELLQRSYNDSLELLELFARDR